LRSTFQHKSSPSIDKEIQIEVFIGKPVSKTEVPVWGSMSQNPLIVIRIDRIVSVKIFDLNGSGYKVVAISVKFFHFCKILRCILPNTFFYEVVVDSQPFADEPPIRDVIYFPVSKLHNTVSAVRKTYRRLPRKIPARDVYRA